MVISSRPVTWAGPKHRLGYVHRRHHPERREGPGRTRAEPPYLHRPTTQVARLWVYAPLAGLVLSVPESAPCPLVAAVFCGCPGADHAGWQGGGRAWSGVHVVSAGGEGLPVRGDRRLAAGGTGQEQPALPRCGAWALAPAT
jgi:hypothetical protein